MNTPNLTESVRSIAIELLEGGKRDIDMFAETMTRRIELAIREQNEDLLRNVAIGAGLLAAKHRLRTRNSTNRLLNMVFEGIVHTALVALTGPQGLIPGAIAAIGGAAPAPAQPLQVETDLGDPKTTPQAKKKS